MQTAFTWSKYLIHYFKKQGEFANWILWEVVHFCESILFQQLKEIILELLW